MKKVILVILVIVLSACGGSKEPSSIDKKVDELSIKNSYVFGKSGKHQVSYEYHLGTKIFFPTDISSQNPTPVVFFVPGYKMNKSDEYKTIIDFIASHGYTVIYAPDINKLAKADWYVDLVTKAAKDVGVAPYIDTTRIGVVGHSLGGGNSFYVLDKLSKNEGWGENGRFIMALDPYFPYGMSNEELKNLPQNTNVIMQKYNKDRSSDPRIGLTTYYLLDSISDQQKDYQVYNDVNHYYVSEVFHYAQKIPEPKSVSMMQYALKPLEALMDLTFEGNEDARAVALEVGNDDPIANNSEEIKDQESYKYKCNAVDGNRFCEILR